jgi:hypothetical protein
MWRTTSRVWCINFPHERVFKGVNGTSTDLDQLGWRQAEGRQPSHMADRSGGPASTDSAFSSSCRRVAIKARAEQPQTLAGRPRNWAGRSTHGPTRPGVWPTWSMCQKHPRGDDDFDIWSTSLSHPLKCSNSVPKFLKSNKR